MGDEHVYLNVRYLEILSCKVSFANLYLEGGLFILPLLLLS